MKIHNPNDLDFDPQSLLALARGELDPVRLAVEEHRQQGNQAGSAQITNDQHNRQALSAAPAIAGAKSRGKPPARQRGSKSTAKESAVKSNIPGSGPKKSAEERLAERDALLLKRRKLARIIRECEALEVVNYDTLAMKYYPEGAAIAAAKRRRDIWLLCCLFCGSMVLVGWQGILSPWFTGLMFGLLVVLLAFCLEPFRHLFYKVPTLSQLKAMRKAMEFKALSHIRMLEGKNGLAFYCQNMIGYNTVLTNKRFQRLVALSKHGSLIKAVQSVAGIRLYLLYVLEAQKAFALVKQQYMKTSSRLSTEFADLALTTTH